MNLRLFIAVAVPGAVKLEIKKILGQVMPLFRGNGAMRWVGEENWHFTVSFLGAEPESVVPLIKAAMVETASALKNSGPLVIDFEKIVYGPTDRPGNSRRMIWLTGASNASQRLGKLKEILEKNLEDQGVAWLRTDHGDFRAHLTLARFEPMDLKTLPSIEQKLDWHYEANSFDLMESHLSRAGARYEKLFGVDF